MEDQVGFIRRFNYFIGKRGRGIFGLLLRRKTIMMGVF
jgi:hypothetical protein